MSEADSKSLEEVEKLAKQLDRKQHETEILKVISGQISSSLDLKETLDSLLVLLDKFFNYEHSMILLSDLESKFLTVFASHGYKVTGLNAKVEIGKGVIGMVAKSKKLLRFGNLSQRLMYASAGEVNFEDVEDEIIIKLPGLSNPRSQVAIPLLVNDELVGVLNVESEDFNVFKEEDADLIFLVAIQAAIAIQNARLFKAERERFEQVERINNQLSELIKEQKRTLSLFVKFVPEPVVRKVLRDKTDSIFQGEQLNIALLFCDIRNFTPISERISPKEVVDLLNSYYTAMSGVIKEHRGVINQFVGDEIFVTFGAPLPVPNSEEKAVKCALEMIDKLADLNQMMAKRIGSEINVGIGINYGAVVAGNLGSEDRMEYSITGDAVNTAKRIESLTRGHPNAILVSQSIFDKTENLIEYKCWEKVKVKGKDEKVQVYQVLRLKEESSK